MINGIKPMVSPQTPTPKEPTTNGLSFDDAMDSLLEKIQENYASRYGENHKPSKLLELSLKPGRKFVKVIEGSSVWGFVSLVNGTHKGAPIFVGDIMKAAGWSAPAKHSRGSIFDAEMHKSFSWTGPNYL
tara:strand:+ start:1178 stop:1567 length:390 start_codon:yes stop_codon:yes gene_type:complete